jgi:hypothetical protein
LLVQAKMCPVTPVACFIYENATFLVPKKYLGIH